MVKQWLCHGCGRRGETDDTIAIKFCNACLGEMKQDAWKNEYRVEKEVKDD